MLSYLRAVQRIGSHTIRFTSKDIAEAADFIEFVTNYGPDLAP